MSLLLALATYFYFRTKTDCFNFIQISFLELLKFLSLACLNWRDKTILLCSILTEQLRPQVLR